MPWMNLQNLTHTTIKGLIGRYSPLSWKGEIESQDDERRSQWIWRYINVQDSHPAIAVQSVWWGIGIPDSRPFSFPRFLDLHASSKALDCKTIWRFGNELTNSWILETLFSQFNTLLQGQGFPKTWECIVTRSLVLGCVCVGSVGDGVFQRLR